jgi:ABC-type glycerol-3-phosphate transport system substrate-binding protein
MRRLSLYLLAALVLALGTALVGCGDDDDDDGGGGGGEVSGDVRIAGVWTGQEAESFQAVLDGFTEENPDVNVEYDAAGDELPTVLATAVEGGNPPDLAAVAQPGLIADFADQGALQPIDFAADTLEENFSEGVLDISTFDGERYGVLFKAANKSTVWYNVPLFEQAGVEPAETYEELLEAADTLNASGTPAYSIGAADGWTMTDLFENIYIRQAGPEMYDQLTEHEIPWTDQSVKDALETMAQIVGDSDNIAGGTAGALEATFPESVQQAFKESPDAAMVIEGDFVGSEITSSTSAEAETDFNVFPFPSVDGSDPMVVGGGDTVVMFEDSPAAQALVEYLATPEAAEIWAERGGFSSANQNLDASVYRDELTRTTASAIAETDTFRFDMSDLQPARFGGTVGQGLWKLFQDFVNNPDNVDQITQQMERAAARAFGE